MATKEKPKKKVNVAKGKAAVAASRGTIRKFRVKEGIHYHGEKVWTKDMIVASRFPLDKMFVNKFEQVHNEVPADNGISDFKYKQKNMREDLPKTAPRSQISNDPEAFDDEELKDDLEPDHEEVENAHFEFLQGAKDVTEDFDFVKEEAEGLKVLQNGKRFGVVAVDNPRELLNKHTPLKRKEVNGFVEKFLDGDLDDPEDEDEEDGEEE